MVDVWKKSKNSYLEIVLILSVTKPCEQLPLIVIFFDYKQPQMKYVLLRFNLFVLPIIFYVRKI